MEFRILDLFCGAGGMSYGMHKNSHFITKVALDINGKVAQTFENNISEAELVIGDIQNKVVKEKIINLSIKNNINMIIGGPPCQRSLLNTTLQNREKVSRCINANFVI